MPPTSEPLHYTIDEIRSYLPTGWSIYPGQQGAFDAGRGRFALRVLDGAQMDWNLEVEAGAARAKGRHEALRLAFDKLFRERLG
jgi:hypothetical protein